ncbi:ATP phosphoribosyltransferase regulatory subunit [Teredinibacter sp. KSP-S5-2]|uniref:ATP phosphoribosyltransferase regulatory subunit n=1 Tax=Teredinibacter sp. KSP-S5-2 TaxID=3034506 RepID=UPI002934D571|nr:ATP phosphoribosyltransferase regulatory subunit [Teredinibacter sp. KSP-S5-2]WNO08168.1 ATP phosphoribosyltransferase regulatory subunit [Teredinibacter sp. KSP-S5-2]
MSKVDRWLLPDGIEEMLPGEAHQTEHLRRSITDLFQRWGYDYVIPPMIEFTDSLLTGSGKDIDLLTFKLTDQISGKTMGLRADITPQAARMDAHSLRREGVNRLCYAGHVMHSRPKGALGSRTPIQAGLELFGVESIDADIEVVSLMLAALDQIKLPLYIDLGHVGIYRGLASAAQLTSEQEHAFFELLQSKSLTDATEWVCANTSSEQAKKWFTALPKLSGSRSVLKKAKDVFQDAPEAVTQAINELELLADTIAERFPEAQMYFDLSELRGYRYHTGIVFGAFAPGMGTAIASGGRYDHVGEAFGRARPATGFALDITAIVRLVGDRLSENTAQDGIFAVASDSVFQWQEINALRASGERVIVGLSGQSKPLDYQQCDRVLVEEDGRFSVQPLS